MSKAKKPQTTWTPFERGAVDLEEAARVQRDYALTAPEIQDMLEGEFWLNNRYQVQKRFLVPQDPHGLTLVWLSIKRRDRLPIKDWRDMQRIKNELVGPECEGVELYPAESRLVDSSNQYHIWVVLSTTFRFPFGFQERLVMEHPGGKARQRPFTA